MKRRKIAYIGSSYKFVHRTVRDFIISKAMENTDIVLYDIDSEPLKIEYDVIKKMIAQVDSKITVKTADARIEALQEADYVVTSLLVGGRNIAKKEDLICQKYGIRHTVGDTVGPMCTARCLRQIPLLLDIAKDMEKVCPNAIMLNVTNPMAVLTNAVNQNTNITCIGICHGTQHRQKQIAESFSVETKDVELDVVGVNHLGFIDGIRVKGVEQNVSDIASRITELAEKGEVDQTTGDRDVDVWANVFAKRLGIIPNNGDKHFTEFFHWFLLPHAFKNEKNSYSGIDAVLEQHIR